MTALSDFCDTVRAWLNREDYDDALVTSWVRHAEERLDESLRIDHMIQIDTATVSAAERRVVFPEDYLEADFIRSVSGVPYRYEARDPFYGRAITANTNMYTIVGRFIVFGGPIDETTGLDVELHYYGRVPRLGDDPTWLSSQFNELLLFSTIVSASIYGIEDERAMAMAGAVTAKIKSLNERHLLSKASGSRLTRKTGKGFG